MILEIILSFSFFLFIYVLLGGFDYSKLKMTNTFLIMYFLLNIWLWFWWFQSEINLSYLWYNLFHVWQIESFFLVLFWIVWIGISLYSIYYFSEYLHHKKNLYFYHLMIIPFFVAMQIIIICSNAMLFLVMWEIMTLSSYFLVIHEYKENVSFEWGNYYLIIAHVWMFFILFSFIPFIISSWSYDFINWKWIQLNQNFRNIAFFAALIWFWAKAWIWPLDIWLPKAHPIAPSNISSIMSSFMVKLPIMMLIKFVLIFFAMKVDLIWWVTLLIIWSISAFLGIFYAITQNDIKRILAFSTIENVWFIIANLWVFVIWMNIWNKLIAILGFTAMLYHIINHSLTKSLMFMIAWSIIERTWTRNISKMWWLIKIIPFLWIITLFACMNMAWIPPFASFNSELTWIMWILKIITDSDNTIIRFIAIWSIILIALMSIFSFISFTRLYTIVFVWRQRSKELTINTKENIFENLSYLLFLIFILFLSVFPWLIINISNFMVFWVNNPINILHFKILDFEFMPAYLIIFYILAIYWAYILYKSFINKMKLIEPWNCWYDHIPHRSQYSSRSLIQPIRRIYEWLYMQASNTVYNDYYKQNRNTLKFLKAKAYFSDIFYNRLINVIKYCWHKVKSLQNWILQYYIWYLFGSLLLMLIVLYFYL